MIIQIDPALPCGQLVGGPDAYQPCGELATQAIIGRNDDGTWEMLPVCARHLQEAENLAPAASSEH
jgi:hypothetical protein